MKPIAKKFISVFKKKVDKLYKDRLIRGYKDPKILEFHEHTFLINVAIYLTIKEMDREFDEDLSVVPELGGRSPTDFMVLINDKDLQLCIEHENNKTRILKNFIKLFNNDKCEERLLICYVYTESKIESEIAEMKKYAKSHPKSNGKVHVLIAVKSPEKYFTSSKDYKYEYI